MFITLLQICHILENKNRHHEHNYNLVRFKHLIDSDPGIGVGKGDHVSQV